MRRIPEVIPSIPRILKRIDETVSDIVSKRPDVVVTVDSWSFSALVKTRIEILPEIKEQVDFFEELPDYDIALYTHKKMKTDPEKSLALLNEVLPVLEAQDDFSNDALFETLKTFATEKGYKVGYVMWPLRPRSFLRISQNTAKPVLYLLSHTATILHGRFHASVSHVPVYLVIVNHLSFDVPLSRDCIEFQTTFFTLPGRARFAH